MRFIISTILIALISGILQMSLPWWSLVIAAFLVGLSVTQSGWISFFSGFLGVAIVWWTYALIIHVQTHNILTGKVAALFHLGSPALLLLLTGSIGGIVGGFASLSGRFLNGLFRN